MSFHLQPHKGFPGVEGPVLICVMDGVGVGCRDESDAVWLARTPNLDRLHEIALCTQLIAHGRGVGMPSDDDMGNSEVGHNALGAGRIVDQGAKLVGRAITSGSLFAGPVWQSITHRVRESGEALHFLGLLSDGNVHSHIDHLFALLGRCDAEDVHMVRIHVLLDGRDVAETSALEFIDALEVMLREFEPCQNSLPSLKQLRDAISSGQQWADQMYDSLSNLLDLVPTLSVPSHLQPRLQAMLGILQRYYSARVRTVTGDTPPRGAPALPTTAGDVRQAVSQDLRAAGPVPGHAAPASPVESEFNPMASAIGGDGNGGNGINGRNERGFSEAAPLAVNDAVGDSGSVAFPSDMVVSPHNPSASTSPHIHPQPPASPSGGNGEGPGHTE
ncbi:MAG: hypothetical protein IH973_09090, partial [Myxococcales bacterium]|nr:hypothetical protein [Myxococcales bacterium]